MQQINQFIAGSHIQAANQTAQTRATGKGSAVMQDNRPQTIVQRKLKDSISATGNAVIQRKVTNYKPTSKSVITAPQDQLKAKVDKSKFTQSSAAVDTQFDKWTNISGSVPIWNKVGATVQSVHGENHPGRSGVVQNHMGLIGRDEFYIRSGQNHAFEGGHVIPLSAWSDTDTKVDDANDYENIVPMSRTTNVGSWAVAESKMKDGVKRNWAITIDRQNYEVPYGALAENFFLTLANPADREQKINMQGITTESIVATPTGGAFPAMAFEPSTIVPPTQMITNGAKLKSFIQAKKGWQYLDDAMQTVVNGIP